MWSRKDVQNSQGKDNYSTDRTALAPGPQGVVEWNYSLSLHKRQSSMLKEIRKEALEHLSLAFTEFNHSWLPLQVISLSEEPFKEFITLTCLLDSLTHSSQQICVREMRGRVPNKKSWVLHLHCDIVHSCITCQTN